MERYKEVLVEINKLRLGNDNLKYQVNKLVYNGTPNFWDIIEYGTSKNGMDRSAHETRYSRMIRWLMDPGENHNQGIFFCKSIN